MNAPITFNTLAFVRRMEASGMDSAQAEALADALREVVFETTATSAEVRESETRLRSDMRESETRLRSEIRESETRVSNDVRDVRGELRELEIRLQGELKEVELRLSNSLMLRLGGAIAASTALTVAILGTVISLH